MRTSIYDRKSSLTTYGSERLCKGVTEVAYFDGTHAGDIGVQVCALHDLVLCSSIHCGLLYSIVTAQASSCTATPSRTSTPWGSRIAGGQQIRDLRGGHGGDVEVGGWNSVRINSAKAAIANLGTQLPGTYLGRIIRPGKSHGRSRGCGARSSRDANKRSRERG